MPFDRCSNDVETYSERSVTRHVHTIDPVRMTATWTDRPVSFPPSDFAGLP